MPDACPPLCPKTHDKNKRRRAVVAALSVAILALAVGSALTTTTGKDSVTMENYSVEHVPDKIASKLPEQTDGAGLSDTGYRVRTRTLVVDAAKISENDTIEDVYAGTDEESVAKLLYQSESVASVYDFGDPDNYVAYLDVSGDAGKTNRPQDVVFAYDTTKGEMIDSILYDRETGLAYIPKLIFEQDRVKNRPENTCELQAQTLVRYDLAHTAVAYEQDKASDSEGDAPALGEISSSTSVPVTVSTDSSALNKMALVPTVGNQFSIAAVDADDAKNVSLSDIEVDINDGAVSLAGDRNGYELGDNLPSISYDEDTGVVHVFNVSPMQVMNATVTVKAAATRKFDLCRDCYSRRDHRSDRQRLQGGFLRCRQLQRLDGLQREPRAHQDHPQMGSRRIGAAILRHLDCAPQRRYMCICHLDWIVSERSWKQMDG